MKKLIITIGFLLLGTLTLANTSFANFNVTRTKDNSLEFNFDINAGGRGQDSIKIENLTNEPLTVKIYAADGIKTSQGDFTLKTTEQEKRTVGKWLKFKEEEISLASKEIKNIPFSVQVPTNITPGIYAGGIAVANLPSKNKSNGGSGINIISRVALKTIINIPGEKIHQFNWKDFTYTAGKNNLHKFNADLENTGNTSVIIEGFIEILGGPFANKSPAAEEERIDNENIININELNLFPEEKINLPYYWDKSPLFGKYTARATLTFYEEDIKTGKKLNPETFSKEVNFSIFPWTYFYMGLGAIILIIILSVIIILHKRSFLKKCLPYVVEHDDTIEKIAAKININWKKLVKINKLHPPYTITPGQTILVTKLPTNNEPPKNQ